MFLALGVLSSSAPVKPVRGPRGRRRDLVSPLTYYERCLYDFIIPCITRFVEAGPSIFSKSPEEHAVESRLARKTLPPQMRHLFYNKSLPHGHVRVRFFKSPKALGGPPETEAILPLERSGEFDLKRVKRLWGLDTCSAVDPIRWKLFEPGKSDLISPVGVYNLLDYYDAINVVEPSISRSTRVKRQLRQKAEPYVRAFQSLQANVTSYLRTHTPIVNYFDETQRLSRVLEWRVEQWATEHTELARISLAILIVAVLLFVFSILQGFIIIDFGVPRFMLR